MRLEMDLPEAKYLSAKAGMDATVVPAATSKKLSGKTATPWPIAKTNGLELTIETGEVDKVLTPGMKAAVSIDAGKIDNVLLVPSTAVADSKVWVKGDDDKPVAKRVITGRTGDDKTEIIDGVKEGDEIFEQAQK